MTGPEVSSFQNTTFEADGRQLLSFAGCNYLGLASHPRVLAAATDAIARFGLSTSASRETSGNTVLHAALERELSATLDAEQALVLPDGYTANLAAAQTLAALGVRHAVIDDRAHRSLFDAATGAGLAVTRYPTACVASCAQSVASLGSDACVIMTDGVFTSDGRIAPVPDLARIGCRLLIDDCHGLGVLGPRGAGSPAHHGVRLGECVIVTSTLAKGIGCAGGFVAATRDFIETARSRASAYICTTPTAPPLIAAAIEALRIARDDGPRRQRLAGNARALAAVLARHQLGRFEGTTPIAAFSLPSEPDMRALARHLHARGLFVPLIAYPGGPCPLYFRASITSEHVPDDLECLDEALGSAPNAAQAVRVLSEHA